MIKKNNLITKRKNKLSKSDEIFLFNSQNIEVGISKKGYGKTYLASRNFKPGEIIMMGYGKVIDHQTSKVSIQIDINKHFIPYRYTGWYWNHSCEPNTCMKTRDDGFPNLIALKPIKKCEEVTYAYWMSECEWGDHTDESKISCKCGSFKCKGKICSFTDLPIKDRGNIMKASICSAHLYKLSK